MKLAITGAGMIGAYLYRLLKNEGCEVHIFDLGEGIWGVGEAIGCVAPLVGDGIVPGMRSVQLLLDAWDKPQHYREAVLGEFRWMKDERRVIDRLRKAEGVGIREARILRRNSQRMGMRVGLREAIALLKNLSLPALLAPAAGRGSLRPAA